MDTDKAFFAAGRAGRDPGGPSAGAVADQAGDPEAAPAGAGAAAGAVGNSVVKTLRVLEALSQPEGPHRLGEIAERSRVAKASTHRILATLIAEGYAVPDGEGRYGVGTRLQAMAARVLADDAVGIEAVLRALQQRLDQAVHLAVLSGEHATYTHKVDPGRAYRIATEVGMQLPLHASAAGKALLAHLPEGDATRLLEKTGLAARTPRTVTHRQELEEQLASVRANGYATDYEEHEQSICSVAAPVLDASGYPVAAVAVSSLTFLVTEEQLHVYAPAVRQAAAEVARRL